MRVSHLSWAKVCLNIPLFIIVKSQETMGVYLTPYLLSSTKIVLLVAFPGQMEMNFTGTGAAWHSWVINSHQVPSLGQVLC